MSDDNNDSRGHSAYDLLKDFGLPAIPVVGMILNAGSAARFTLFFAVAVLFGAFGLWPRIARYARKRRARWRDERFAEREFARFKQCVRRFGDFVDTRTNDTLHRIVANELSDAARSGFAAGFDSRAIELWNNFWYFFDQRVHRQQPRFAELSWFIQEFNNLIGKYHAYCVAPIFDRLSSDTRAMLTDADRSKLNGFHHRYNSFVIDYTQFLRSLAESHPDLKDPPRYLPISNPL